MERICKNCRWRKAFIDEKGNAVDGSGLCKRFPPAGVIVQSLVGGSIASKGAPQIIQQPGAVSPPVADDNFCGEFAEILH